MTPATTAIRSTLLLAAAIGAASNEQFEGDPNCLEMETVAKGTFSGIVDEGTSVIKTQAAWMELWTQHGSTMQPLPELPAVDFDRKMVLRVFTGQKHTGGYGVEIKRVELQGSTLTVSYETSSPPPGNMATFALTQPFHMVKVDAVPEVTVDFSESQAAPPAATKYVFTIILRRGATDEEKTQVFNELQELRGVTSTHPMFQRTMATVQFDASMVNAEDAERSLRGILDVDTVEADLPM